MAITFAEEQKFQKYFLFAAIVVFILTGFILWRGLFILPQEGNVSETFLVQPPQLNIDFSIFDTQGFQDLGKGKEPLLPPKEVGRENPFTPF